MGAPAHVRYLAHGRGALVMNLPAELPEVRDAVVGRHVEHAETSYAVGRYRRRAAEHDETRSTLCLLEMVGLETIGQHPAFGVSGRVCGDDEPVFQLKILQLERLKNVAEPLAVNLHEIPLVQKERSARSAKNKKLMPRM